MPTPKYKKYSQEDFDNYWAQNEKRLTARNWTKDLAQHVWLTKRLNEQGANISFDANNYTNDDLKQIYELGYDGPNPYMFESSNKKASLGDNAIELEVNESSQNSSIAPDGSIISNSVLDNYPERFQYTAQPDQTLVRSRYHHSFSDEDIDAAKRSKALEGELRTEQGQLAFSSIKQEMTDYLKEENNGWFNGKYADHFDNDFEGAKDWWYYAASYYQRLKHEEGEMSARNWLNQAVQKRVMDTQTGWEATREIPQQFINNFVSGAASDIGILWGIGAGFFRAAFDQDESLDFWQEWGKNIIDNDLMNYANAVMEQGRIMTSSDFNPDKDMPTSFISSQNVGAAALSQTAYGVSSLAVGGLDKLAAEGIKRGVRGALGTIARNEGRLAARQAQRAASRSATRLLDETEEEFVKRQAKLQRQREARDIFNDQMISGHMALGEAGLDANDTYHQVLDYSVPATDVYAAQKAEERLRKEMNIQGDIYEWLAQATEDILNGEAQQQQGDHANSGTLGYSADEYNTVYNGLRKQIMDKLKQYTDDALNNPISLKDKATIDDIHSNNLAVAIKTGMLTLATEGAVVWAADAITDHTLSRESHRNLRRRHGMGDTRTKRGLTWNEQTGRMEVNLPSSGQEWGRATGKWAIDATAGEVLPENLQNLFSQSSQAIGMNAIDQYIVARSNGDEAEIGDLHFGEGGLKDGLRAGWSAMKDEAANTSIITYLSTLMPNLNPSALRGIVHRPDNVSVKEHLSNLLGNGITRNYFEELNKDKHVRFYNDEINNILDQAPWLQNALQEGITLKNYSDMVSQAYDAGDMASAEQAELGQLVTMLAHMNAVDVKNSPLAFINNRIDRITKASTQEEKDKIVNEHLKKNPSLLRPDETIETLSDDRKAYFFDELRENAQRMKDIQTSVKQASDAIRENFSTYDERIQNALIFGKVFNEALQSDIDAARQKLQNTVSQTAQQQETTEGSVNMEAISKQRKIVQLNNEQDKLSRIQNELTTMQQLAEKGTDKEIFDYVSNAYANNRNVTVTDQNFRQQFERRVKAYAKDAKQQTKIVNHLKKEAKGITDTAINISANDLINGDADARRFLLNEDNWSLLSKETKARLRELTDTITVHDPSFMQEAYRLANNEVMMQENRDALTAYINDPDKLRPAFQRVARIKRDKKNNTVADRLNTIKDYNQFVKEYVEATEQDKLEFNGSARSVKKKLDKALERAERNQAIRERLKNNENFKRYTKNQRMKKAMSDELAERQRRDQRKLGNNPEPEKVSDAAISEYRDLALFNYLVSKGIELSDINAIEAALKETIENPENPNGGYLKTSKYAQFVRDFVKDDNQNDIAKQVNPDFLTYQTFNEAYSAAVSLFNAAQSEISRADAATRDLKNTRMVNQMPEQTEAEEHATSNYDLLQPDDPLYAEPIDIDIETPATLAHKIAYGFRLTNDQLVGLQQPIEHFLHVIREIKDENKKKHELIYLNNLISKLRNYTIDKSLPNNVNFINAINSIKSTNKPTEGEVALSSNTNILRQELSSFANQIKMVGNAQAATSAQIRNYLDNNTVETINFFSVMGKERKGTFETPAERDEHQKRQLLLEFANKLNVLSFLNSPAIQSIITLASNRHHTKLSLLSGDMVKDKDGSTLNERLEKLINEQGGVYDKDSDGALMVAVEISDKIYNSEGMAEYKDGFLDAIDPVTGTQKHYQVIGFVPPLSSTNNEMVKRWRTSGTLWNSEDDTSKNASRQQLYVPRHGIKFSYDRDHKNQGVPLKYLRKIVPNFSQLIPHLSVKTRTKKNKEGNTDTYRQLIIRENTDDTEFTIFNGKNADGSETQGISIFIAPMQQTVSQSSAIKNYNGRTVSYNGKTLEDILLDDEAGTDMLREMHHYKKPGQKEDSWGRMGQFIFLMRKLLIEAADNPQKLADIANIIGSKPNPDAPKEQRILANRQIFRLPKGCKIVFNPRFKELQLNINGQVKTLLSVTPEILQQLSDWKNTVGYDELNSQDKNSALKLNNHIDFLDKIIFQFTQNLMLTEGNDRHIATHKDWGLTSNTEERGLFDSAVHWNLFYGTSDVFDSETNTTRHGSLSKLVQSSMAYETWENLTRNDRATTAILRDFYENGLLIIRDRVENLFVTDNPNDTGSNIAISANEQDEASEATITTKQNENYPPFIQSLINITDRMKANRGINDRGQLTTSATSISSLVNVEQKEFDEDSEYAEISHTYGNTIDLLAKDFFGGHIVAEADGFIYVDGSQRIPLTNRYMNATDEDLQNLCLSLYKTKDKWETEGFIFLDRELFLSGYVLLTDGDGGAVETPINGKPDIIAYHPDGRIRIIDVKTKHTNDAKASSFWSENKDTEQNMATLTGQSLNQYTAQVNLYRQFMEQNMGGDAKVESVYLLEVPVAYENPTDPDNPPAIGKVEYKTDKNDDNKIIKLVDNVPVPFDVTTGTAHLHQRPFMEMDNHISIIDRYRSLARQLRKKQQKIVKLQDTLATTNDRKERIEIQKKIGKLKSQASVIENIHIQFLSDQWKKLGHQNSLQEEAGNIDTSNPLMMSGSIEKKTELEDKIKKDVVQETAVLACVSALRQNLDGEPASKIFTTATMERLGITDEYTITTEYLGKNPYLIDPDPTNPKIQIGVEFLTELANKYPNVSPDILCENLNCRI